MTETKAWQKGYPMERLCRLAGFFDKVDRGRVFGRFSKIKENQIAAWLDAGKLREGDGWVCVGWERQRVTPLRDFRGELLGELPPGWFVANRIGCLDEGVEGLADFLISEGQRAAWVLEDHPESERACSLAGMRPTGVVKISAASERTRLWVLDDGHQEIGRAPEVEHLGISPLRLEPDWIHLSTAMMWARAAVLEAHWADHYSSYNIGGSWSSLSLRGFSEDPSFIAKPAEMSKGWKAKNPEALLEPCRDTPLMFDSIRKLLSEIPADFERVRMMRLDPGGSLSRHADITDRDAGIQDGKIARLHLPLMTNPDVVFRTWPLAGPSHRVHMERGTWRYLDIRKPHAARNDGSEPRVHLVADAIATPELRALLLPR